MCVSTRLCGRCVCVCSCVAPDGWDGLQNADDEEVGIGKARELLEEELWHTVQQCVVAVCVAAAAAAANVGQHSVVVTTAPAAKAKTHLVTTILSTRF